MKVKLSSLLWFVLCASALPVDAFETLDGTRARWRNMPVRYSINSNSPDVDLAAQQTAIANGFAAWADVSNANLNFSQSGGAQITVDFDTRWPREWGREAAGITITTRNNSRISSAEVHFNNQHFEWSTSGTPGLTDIQGVATHEFGHAIGFGHSFYFESTMYWTGGDVRLRTLSDDDMRGTRFLYGDANARRGMMCDTCLSNDDCNSGAYCLQLEQNKYHCGQRCTRTSDCPEHSDCFELNNGERSCAPLAFACSDDPLTLEPGDYCFGANQCGSGSQCISLETTAECVRSCTPPNGNCPGGGECYPTGNPETPGLCIPPGDVAEGGICGSFQNRCQQGLECAFVGDRPRCFSFCEPNGRCSSGFGCSPLDEERWVCLALSGPQQGEPCRDGLCAGGLTCLSNSEGQQICAPGCLPSDPNACGGTRCFELRPGVGACSPGTQANGEPCAGNLDCVGGYCLFRGSGRTCTQPCAADRPCPANYECARLNSGDEVCVPSDQGGPVSVSDSGVSSPNRLDQGTGTSNTRRDVGAPQRRDGGTTRPNGPTFVDGGMPPVIFFNDEPAEVGCACAQTTQRPISVLLFVFGLIGLNAFGRRYVTHRGGHS